MARARVPVYGTVGKSIQVNPNATDGATIGTNLRLPNGTVPTLAQLATALGVGSSSGGSTLAYTIWRLVQEIPPNVQAVAALASAGIVARLGDGSWTTRQIASADTSRITVANPGGQTGNPTLDLAEIDYGDAGALLAIALDAYGRVSGYRDALLDDLDDVVTTTPAEHDALMYDGASWVNTPTGPRYLPQTVDEVFYAAADFVRGHNIIGVRYVGDAFVYLPSDLPAERIIIVKAETGATGVTIQTYAT